MNQLLIVIIVLSSIIGLFMSFYFYDRFTYGYNSNLIKHPQSAEEIFKSNTGYSISAPNKGLTSTLSFWVYIDSWDYRFMQKKHIFNKGGFHGYLAEATPDMIIEMPTFNNNKNERIIYNNVPVQKWVHILIIVDNRNIDIWVNGELYKSKYLDNLPIVVETDPLIISPHNGFRGMISNLNVWEHSVRKGVIKHMHKEGPNYKGFFGNFKDTASPTGECVPDDSKKSKKDASSPSDTD
jgi:hypothetical protein